MENWADYEVRQKFYHSTEWVCFREYVLTKRPLCIHCGERNTLTPATEVDHIIPIIERPELRLDIKNVQPLCHSCHSKKTIAEVRSRMDKTKNGKIISKWN